ncbi:bile acid:sodium symporter family protein [Salibacterium aidingense]|uniref:bile acid:sodium symporter family protein n=1 Tax=Salibacterium aidingense TaxID=384933 RepID=UPI000553632E|nr:bile acid:sodium symporter family protein [Salibacterium aidingense]
MKQFNMYLEKLLPYLIPLIVLLGVTVLSGAQVLAGWVKWIFAFVSFSSCLRLNLLQVKQAILFPFPVITGMLLLQVIVPVIAYTSGLIFFTDDILLIAGLVLAFTIPTGVITIMWSDINKANTGLTVTIVILNTMVSPLLVPVTLNILVGTQVSMDVPGIMLGLFWMVVLPSLAAVLFNRISETKAQRTGSFLAPFSKIGVLIVILINSAVVAPYFQTISMRLIFLFFLVFGIACAAYILGFTAAKVFKWEDATAVSLMYTAGMRNTGVGATIAVTYFPPAAALPVVLAIVFQQFLASFAGRLVQMYAKKQEKKEGAPLRQVK